MSNTKQPTPLGGVIFADTPIEFNTGKPETKIKVRNTRDRPIQVGSHFHFFEVNHALEFDREAAYGKRLNISSTTAIRFESVMKLKFLLFLTAANRQFTGLTTWWTAGPVIMWPPANVRQKRLH